MTLALALVLIPTLLVGLAGNAAARPKTDVVALENGDRTTCEIKELARGKLRIKTDAMGTIYIEWADIAELHSDFFFRVESREGQRLFGTLAMDADSTQLRVTWMSLTASLAAADVVEIVPIEQSFWSSQDGSLSFGFNYTKASDVLELTFDWVNAYRTERNLYDLKALTTLTDKGDSTGTIQRTDLSFSYHRLLKGKWTGNTSLALQRNDELDLQRRIILSVGLGISPIKNNWNILLFSIGAALNSELATTATDTVESGEGVFTASYSLFKYNSPKTDISTSLNFYPSITQDDRYRLNLDIKLRREIIHDLFLDISYYQEYDSKAPSGEGEKKDYGIVTSVGWSY